MLLNFNYRLWINVVKKYLFLLIYKKINYTGQLDIKVFNSFTLNFSQRDFNNPPLFRQVLPHNYYHR